MLHHAAVQTHSQIQFKEKCHPSHLAIKCHSLQYPNSKVIGCSSTWWNENSFMCLTKPSTFWQWCLQRKHVSPFDSQSPALLVRHSSSQKENKFAAAKQFAKNVRTEDPIIRAVVAFLSKALLKKLGSSYAQKESAKIFLNCSLSLQSVENCSKGLVKSLACNWKWSCGSQSFGHHAQGLHFQYFKYFLL